MWQCLIELIIDLGVTWILLSQCVFMGTSSASCSRSNMIFSVPTSVSFLTFNLVLHTMARETYFDPIVIVFLLQCPPTYTFLHLNCASSKIYAWFSSYYCNDIWNVISSKRPSLITVTYPPSFHYFLFHTLLIVSMVYHSLSKWFSSLHI